jgi:pyruvate/2-oxoglutarate dehydrogenase complex dihydrolipoamide dehydrogenase (E3) component
VERTEEGNLILDETLRTTAEHIWAVGDVTGALLFTHVANYEAGIVVDALTGHPRRRDYRVVPRVTFTAPEVASVGLTEREATEQVGDVRVGHVDLAHDERSVIDGRTSGLVKIVSAPDGRILGAHIVAEQAGAMIHEVVPIMAGDVPAQVVGDAMHAYPTVSQAVKQALLAIA